MAQATYHLTDHLVTRCAPKALHSFVIGFMFFDFVSTMASRSNFPYPSGARPFVPAASENPFGISNPMPLSLIMTQTQQGAVGPATGGGFRHGSGAGSPAIVSPSRLRSLTRSASRASTRRERSRDRDGEEDTSRQRQLGPRDRREVAEVLEDLKQDMVSLDRVIRNHGQAIAKSNERIAALEATMGAYRKGCATMEVNIFDIGYVCAGC